MAVSVCRRFIVKEDIQTQYTLKNLRGHSVRLDIYARDAAGTRYNVEIQNGDKGAIARRARYYSSLMDAQKAVKKAVRKAAGKASQKAA